MGLRSGGQEGPAHLQYLWGHPCYWSLLENAKSASAVSPLTLAMTENY